MMTVRCPNCEAIYQLDASKLADGGRKLKCAKCHTVWIAKPEEPVVAAPVAEENVAPMAAETEAEVKAEGEAPAEPIATADDLPPPPEDLIERTPGVEALVRVGGWRNWVRGDNIWRSGAMAMIAIGVLAGAGVVAMHWLGGAEKVTPKVDVVPQDTETHQDMTVQPPKGVVLHRVHGEVVPVEGGEGGVALTVRGLLTNTTSESIVVPALRLELLGTDGKVADMWPVSNVSGTLAPQAEEAWTVSLTAPDMSSVKGWRVVFVAEKALPEPKI